MPRRRSERRSSQAVLAVVWTSISKLVAPAGAAVPFGNTHWDFVGIPLTQANVIGAWNPELILMFITAFPPACTCTGVATAVEAIVKSAAVLVSEKLAGVATPATVAVTV